MWVMPPEHSGACVAHMEDSLELSHMPYAPQVPLVCLDAQPMQLSKATRQPLPAEPGQPERYDYEDERNGTATICMGTEPLSGLRTVRVRAHKTALDWAVEVQQLLETQSPEADRIQLVCDNLNTHGLGSLYEAFPPEPAPCTGRTARDPPYPQAWQLAPYCRDRTQCADPAMPGPTEARYGHTQSGNSTVGTKAQYVPKRGGLAVFHA
jgi:hypothetical protein